MNNTSLQCSLDNTEELRKLILENPELPLLVFCGEESYTGEYAYNQVIVNSCRIDELTSYDDLWLDKDELEEKLSDELCDEEEYKNLSDEEFEKMISEKAEEFEFVKAIVIYVG